MDVTHKISPCLKTVFIILLFIIPSYYSNTEELRSDPVKIGIYMSPPFVMFDRQFEQYEGMAIDLWQLIEESIGIQSEYKRFQSLDEILNATELGIIDVIVTNLTVTHERTNQVKFSFPWYDAGLRIMVRHNNKSSMWDVLHEQGQIIGYIILFTGIILICLIITIVKRKKSDADSKQSLLDSFSFNFHDVIFAISSRKLPESFAITHEKYRWIWNIFSALWMLGCVGLIAYITSTVTTAMTTVSLSKTEIQSLYDLGGKRVGILKGSATVNLFPSSGIQFLYFDEIEDAESALASGSIDAIIADAPVLEYHAFSHPEQNLLVVGELFNADKYAFGVSLQHIEFADQISAELIRLIELGKIEELRAAYFGEVY